MRWLFSKLSGSKALGRIGDDAFTDGFRGAGLFRGFGRPGSDGGRVEDQIYSLMLTVASVIALLVLIGCIVDLFVSHHHKAALGLVCFGVLWLFSGYDRARIAGGKHKP
jgi:hypothetical protein